MDGLNVWFLCLYTNQAGGSAWPFGKHSPGELARMSTIRLWLVQVLSVFLWVLIKTFTLCPHSCVLGSDCMV